MKPLILVPPAQAEALFDTQDDLRSGEIPLRQPWRDEEAAEEPLAYEFTSRSSKKAANAQLWPSSANSSR